MKKWPVVRIIILSVLCAWLFDIFLGRPLLAKLSTWPPLNRWHILAPQAPIVINNRQEVRVSGNGDLLQAANSAKSKISTVVSATGDKIAVTGAAVNLTSDGLFATGSGAFAPRGNYFVIFYDGTSAPIVSTAPDPATGLTFFKVDLNNVPVAPLGDSAQAAAGDLVLFLLNSPQSFNFKFFQNQITFPEAEVFGQIFSSDRGGRSFGVQSVGSLLPGEPVINANGEVIGIWNGGQIVSSNNLRQALGIYTNNNKTFSRPSFGFEYQIITSAEGQVLGLPLGARVTAVTAAGLQRAAEPALLAGDIITAVDGAAVNQDHPLDVLLQKYKPGDKPLFSISRAGQALTISVTAGVLK
jgi:S1-C subfamily serine protease